MSVFDFSYKEHFSKISALFVTCIKSYKISLQKACFEKTVQDFCRQPIRSTLCEFQLDSSTLLEVIRCGTPPLINTIYKLSELFHLTSILERAPIWLIESFFCVLTTITKNGAIGRQTLLAIFKTSHCLLTIITR